MLTSTAAASKNSNALLRPFLRPYVLSIICASICSLVLGAIAAFLSSLIGPSLQVLMPEAAGRIFALSELFGDRIAGVLSQLSGVKELESASLISFLPKLLICTSAIKATVYICQNFLWQRTGELVATDIRQAMLTGYLNLSPNARICDQGLKVEAQLAGVLAFDVKILKDNLIHFYGGFPREILQVVFLVAILLNLSPKLFILFFFFVLPVVVVITRLGKKLRRKASRALTDYSLLTEWLQQRLIGIETIKHYRTETSESEAFESLTDETNKKFLSAAKVKARTSPSIELFAVSALVGVLFFALKEIEHKNLTPAIVTSFFASLALIAQSGSTIGRYFNSNREGSSARDRIFQLLSYFAANENRDNKTKRDQNSKIDNTSNLLVCENLTLKYPDSKNMALEKFSYSFQKGQIYCLTGPSGSGKTSLFRAILGVLEPESGAIFKQVGDRKDLCGYMPQDPQLLSGSIAENICYPLKLDTKRSLDIANALISVGLDKFVELLPKGHLSIVGDGGHGLSGGQTQRVLMARIFYHRFPLVLFDEGTSALDPETEHLVYDNLKKLKAMGVCVIMISHRTSAQRITDHQIRLNAGKLSP